MKKLFLILISILTINGCTSIRFPEKASLEKQVNYCMELYNAGEYTYAKNFFSRLTPYVRATRYEDKVAYFLGMTSFQSKEYYTAIESFQNIFINTINSTYKKPAHFMIGLSYYNISPKFGLDQEVSERAIQQFQSFIDTYPIADRETTLKNLQDIQDMMVQVKTDSLRLLKYKDAEAELMSKIGHIDTVKLAEQYIQELRDRLAKKLFESASQYSRIFYNRAAELYYNEVTEKYTDTQYYEPAFVEKIMIQVRRKQWRTALISIDRYDAIFPDNVKKIEDYKKTALYGVANFEQEEKERMIQQQLNAPLIYLSPH